MRRKEEYETFKKNLIVLTKDVCIVEKERAKEVLIDLFRKDAPLVLSIIRNGYFFDGEANMISNHRLIDILDSNLYGYKLPTYYEVIGFIKEKKF